MDRQQKGTPPHEKPWPEGERYDQELLMYGDSRNVEDKYRYWTVAAIKADMDRRSVELEVAIENWQHDFNIGTIVRNANAFNVRKVHIIGKKQWNRRGAMVTDAYLTIVHHKTVSDFIKQVHNRTIIAVDNQPGSTNLTEVELPYDAVLVFGGEGPGVSEQMREMSNQMIAIEQLGSTRSVNVGVASGIMMYKWVETHILANKKHKA